MAVRKPGYPWRSRKPLTNREARLISDAANSVTVGGYGIDAVVNHGRTVITNTKPHMSALCRVMTQAQVDEVVTPNVANPNWSVAGANTKKHWDGAALVDDLSQSVWCMPLQTADEKDALEPILVFLPMGGVAEDNDKIVSIWNYSTGRWEGVSLTQPVDPTTLGYCHFFSLFGFNISSSVYTTHAWEGVVSSGFSATTSDGGLTWTINDNYDVRIGIGATVFNGLVNNAYVNFNLQVDRGAGWIQLSNDAFPILRAVSYFDTTTPPPGWASANSLAAEMYTHFDAGDKIRLQHNRHSAFARDVFVSGFHLTLQQV